MNCFPDIAVNRLPEGHTYISRGFRMHLGMVAYESDAPQAVDGFVQVIDGDGRHGLVDAQGRVAVPCEHAQIDAFNDRCAIVSRPRISHGQDAPHHAEAPRRFRWQNVDTGELDDTAADILRRHEPRYYGCVDIQGREVLPCTFEGLRYFAGIDRASDRFGFRHADSRWGVIDAEGADVLPAIYDDVRAFGIGSFQALIVRKGDAFGAFDAQGEEIIPLMVDEVFAHPGPYCDHHGLLLAFLWDGAWGVVDLQGNELARPAFPTVEDACDAAAEEAGAGYFSPNPRLDRYGAVPNRVVRGTWLGGWDNVLQGYANAQGKVVVPRRYEYAAEIGKSMYLASKPGKETYRKVPDAGSWWLFDDEGNRIFDQAKSDIFLTCTGKIAAMSPKGKATFYDEDERTVTRPGAYYDFRKFTPCAPYYLITDYAGEHHGLADGDGRVALPTEYRFIYGSEDYTAEAGSVCVARHADGGVDAIVVEGGGSTPATRLWAKRDKVHRSWVRAELDNERQGQGYA